MKLSSKYGPYDSILETTEKKVMIEYLEYDISLKTQKRKLYQQDYQSIIETNIARRKDKFIEEGSNQLIGDAKKYTRKKLKTDFFSSPKDPEENTTPEGKTKDKIKEYMVYINTFSDLIENVPKLIDKIFGWFQN